MGKSSSKSKGSGTQPRQHITRVDGTKHIILLHHSQSKEEIKRVKRFKDVLVRKAPGQIDIARMINLSANPDDVPQIDQTHKVILIRLTPEGIETINEAARKYYDENNQLHGRVLSVAFGNSLPDGWPPLGARNAGADQKDFCLGQNNPDDDFDEARINTLISAIMAS